MLQVARLSPRQLGDSKQLIIDFLHREHNNGAFPDRAGNPDLYYTVFGLECLQALSVDLPIEAATAFLRTFDAAGELDLVHTACLVRCWANVSKSVPADLRYRLAERLEYFRTQDGGYGADPAEPGTLYGCFLALGAYQDLKLRIPDTPGILKCITRLRAADGGYANRNDSEQGLTSATASAAAILRQLDAPTPPETGDWLLARQHSSGGFFAAPAAPIPDLLSTATALHALSGLQVPIERTRESTLDYLDSLWTSRGGFVGSWADDTLDCEYTYYGLLALGHLSL